ncbi:MAG: hypothetical protein HDR13_12735 [Lachnospiraceae bacterium]|nr:hypothetical protein [Lachnospiraceae bacterium]
MSRRGKKKKKGMGIVIFLSFVIVVSAVVLIGLVRGNLADGIKSAVTEKVTEQVMEQAFQKALESVGDPQAAAKAKEIVNNMDESDKKEAEAIIEKYADSDTLSDVMDIVGDGVNSESISQVEQYLKNTVSDEDVDKLQELYEKYKDEIN